ncbi:unnamed protein product [Ceutorhynchus assimilis]|uniref:Retinol dehydrogenase 13 n=1 Tax=Ceutorhynchus assimilis TaxID=467358 RepID=A0A9N9QT79_9CUCU|nr:unnamed protein product [Ceutorhynchus assimilis]
MHLLFWILIAVAVILIAIIVGIKLWVKLTTGWCRNDVRLVGKTAIITGANTGIGYETAADFAKRGARVILACRNVARGKEAEEKITRATNNRNVIFKQMDLASFQSIKAFAEDIKKNEERQINIYSNKQKPNCNIISEDGLLLPMQINYFGHFLLTNLLLDLIKSTPNSRIVNVASIGAKWTREFDVTKLNEFPEHNSQADLLVYSWSKLCNILFTIELADRLKGTSSSIEGAQTTIYCSTEKAIENFSGEHFEDCRRVARYPTAQDPELAKKLWVVSEELVKLNT